MLALCFYFDGLSMMREDSHIVVVVVVVEVASSCIHASRFFLRFCFFSGTHARDTQALAVLQNTWDTENLECNTDSFFVTCKGTVSTGLNVIGL